MQRLDLPPSSLSLSMETIDATFSDRSAGGMSGSATGSERGSDPQHKTVHCAQKVLTSSVQQGKNPYMFSSGGCETLFQDPKLLELSCKPPVTIQQKTLSLHFESTSPVAICDGSVLHDLKTCIRQVGVAKQPQKKDLVEIARLHMHFSACDRTLRETSVHVRRNTLRYSTIGQLPKDIQTTHVSLR